MRMGGLDRSEHTEMGSVNWVEEMVDSKFGLSFFGQ